MECPHMNPHDPLIDSSPQADRHTGRNGHHPGTIGSRSLATPADEELDALADLFLGPTEHDHTEAHPHNTSHITTLAPRTPAPETARRLSIEGVVLGHLPVSAAAWPGQYARTRAEQLGAPIAVVRLALGTLTVDLFGAEAPDSPLPSETHALEAVRALATTVILRVDAPTEAQLPSLPAVDRLCLLTGADDAAIVACYRKLKDISAVAETTGLPLPEIHLTIMGGDNAKASLAHQRIAGAASAFLDADLLEPVIISRIGPTGSTALYRGPTDLSLETLCDLLTLPRPETGLQKPVAPAPAPAAHEAVVPVPLAEPIAHPVVVPPKPEPVRTPTARPMPKPVVVETREPQPAPTPTPRIETPTTDTLSALVAGLKPLVSRCPLTERIELAADEDGRLHLVAAVLTNQPDRSSPDALSDLLRAAAWARLNADMLCRVEPQLAAQTEQPGVHLVTDHASLATPLLDTAIRVHLAIAATPTAFGLVATPLDG